MTKTDSQCFIVPEFIAKEIQLWLARACVRQLFIKKTSHWENRYVKSFNGWLQDELLDRELFLSLAETRVVLDEWRMDYNRRRPRGGVRWINPAACVAVLADMVSGAFPAATRGISRSGLCPSLRHTARTVPQLAHEPWYGNRERVRMQFGTTLETCSSPCMAWRASDWHSTS